MGSHSFIFEFVVAVVVVVVVVVVVAVVVVFGTLKWLWINMKQKNISENETK